VVTATIGGSKGDGMVVNMHVSAIDQIDTSTIILILIRRSKTLLEMSMESRKTLLARREWHLLPTLTRRLMSASKI
jgi:hypothetical protein